MSVVVYADKDGNTIPRDFITELDPPPQGIEVIPSPYLERTEEEITDADLIGKEVVIDDSTFVIEKIDPVAYINPFFKAELICDIKFKYQKNLDCIS